jgi:hypothetical protein
MRWLYIVWQKHVIDYQGITFANQYQEIAGCTWFTRILLLLGCQTILGFWQQIKKNIQNNLDLEYK